jgi:hypothetical protein
MSLLVLVKLIYCSRGFGIIGGWLIPFTHPYLVQASTMIWGYIPFIQNVGEKFPSLMGCTSKSAERWSLLEDSLAALLSLPSYTSLSLAFQYTFKT